MCLIVISLRLSNIFEAGSDEKEYIQSVLLSILELSSFETLIRLVMDGSIDLMILIVNFLIEHFYFLTY
ncbi:hypothetical protein HanIR_Chr12g0567991 [Helianthus annuus]|nr:hypothetical protein HanIR_Chr12g0567991 [Helianthus annuus]